MARLQKAATSLAFIALAATPQTVSAADDGEPPVMHVVSLPTSSILVEQDLEISHSESDEIRRLFNLYIDARSFGNQDEADSLAKRIVATSINSFGRESRDTAMALTNLGDLQTANSDYELAIKNYAAAIEIVEGIENNLSMDLISPLRGLGSAQLMSGNTDYARTAWNRAVHISHVNLGPHNFRQVETLYSIAALYADAGKIKDARKVRRRIQYLHKRDADLSSGKIEVEEDVTIDALRK